jgi:hypothetical protein
MLLGAQLSQPLVGAVMLLLRITVGHSTPARQKKKHAATAVVVVVAEAVVNLHLRLHLLPHQPQLIALPLALGPVLRVLLHSGINFVVLWLAFLVQLQSRGLDLILDHKKKLPVRYGV